MSTDDIWNGNGTPRRKKNASTAGIKAAAGKKKSRLALS